MKCIHGFILFWVFSSSAMGQSNQGALPSIISFLLDENLIDLSINGSLSPTNITVGDSTTLSLNVVGDSPSITVDWGDGTTNDERTHTYTSASPAGGYTVTVSAVEQSGDEESDEVEVGRINVNGVAPPPPPPNQPVNVNLTAESSISLATDNTISASCDITDPEGDPIPVKSFTLTSPSFGTLDLSPAIGTGIIDLVTGVADEVVVLECEGQDSVNGTRVTRTATTIVNP